MVHNPLADAALRQKNAALVPEPQENLLQLSYNERKFREVNPLLSIYRISRQRRRPMRLGTLFFLLTFLLTSLSYADTSSHRKAAEEVLILTAVDRMIEPAFQQIEQMQLSQLRQMDLPEEAYSHAQKYIQRIYQIMGREMRWDNIKEDYINLYVNVFTESELRELIRFYQTPLGQKLIEKTPVLMQRSMRIGQQKMMRVMPEIQAISREMMQELKEKYGSD
jgi:uncharacterized protein